MRGQSLKGHLDLLLLSVVASGPKHGYAVMEALREASGEAFDLPEGTIYPALNRLEQEGLLGSDWSVVQGRRRRTYRLTGPGREALAEHRTGWEAFAAAVNRVIGVAPMAGYQLIDTYLAGLRRRLLWCPNADDVIAEAEDHLLCAVERRISDGAAGESAQEAAIGRFGDSATVASAYAATSRAGLAMPTKFTKMVGVAALAGAGMWIVSAALWLIDEIVDPSGNAMSYLRLASLVSAAVLTAVVVVGLNRRHGGLGPLGAIGLALVSLGVLATVLFWFVMGWGSLLAAGMLLVALAVHFRGLAPTAATAAFGGAWAIGVITWSVLRVLEVGSRNQWGDYPIVSPIAITVGVVILAPGLIGLGRWLNAETPADLDSQESLAAISRRPRSSSWLWYRSNDPSRTR